MSETTFLPYFMSTARCVFFYQCVYFFTNGVYPDLRISSQHYTVVSERVVLKTVQTNVIGPVIYRIAHPSPLRGFTRIENQVSAHARAQLNREWCYNIIKHQD